MVDIPVTRSMFEAAYHSQSKQALSVSLYSHPSQPHREDPVSGKKAILPVTRIVHDANIEVGLSSATVASRNFHTTSRPDHNCCVNSSRKKQSLCVDMQTIQPH